MESVKATIRYIVNSTIRKVQEMEGHMHINGVGPDAKFESVSRGWFIWIEGSYEAIYIGHDKPEFEVGDKVKITFERIA